MPEDRKYDYGYDGDGGPDNGNDGDLSEWIPVLIFLVCFPPVGVVLLVLKRPLLYAFGASDATYPYADGYLTIYLLGSVFVLVAGLVYRRHKSRRSALWGSLLGAVLMALVSLPSNYFVVYPAYEVLYGLPMTGIIGMYEAIMGSIAHVPTSNSLFNCLLVFNVPFTLFKGLLDVGICFLIYKPLSPLLHK